MLKHIALILTLLTYVIIGGSTFAKDKAIVMGFKNISKGQLIGDLRSNEGLYKDLFKMAAKELGYNLKIVRLPKKRVHLALRKGTIDFYPGSSFSKERSKYLYYLPNGLKTKEVLVSLSEQREITNMSNANGRLMVGLGSSKIKWDEKYKDLKVNIMSKLSMPIVVKALKSNRGDFYIADIEIVDSYKKENSINDLSSIGIRIHENAISRNFIKMYLGFSRNSPLFKERKNEYFNTQREISISNFPTKIDEDCIAYKLYKILVKYEKNGTTKALYQKHHKAQKALKIGKTNP